MGGGAAVVQIERGRNGVALLALHHDAVGTDILEVLPHHPMVGLEESHALGLCVFFKNGAHRFVPVLGAVQAVELACHRCRRIGIVTGRHIIINGAHPVYHTHFVCLSGMLTAYKHCRHATDGRNP